MEGREKNVEFGVPHATRSFSDTRRVVLSMQDTYVETLNRIETIRAVLDGAGSGGEYFENRNLRSKAARSEGQYTLDRDGNVLGKALGRKELVGGR